jgi:hypothetical protein
MPNQIFVDPSADPGPVIQVGGVCYYQVGPSPKPPDTFAADIQAVFSSCDECPSSSSSSSRSSSSSSSSNSSTSSSGGPCSMPSPWPCSLNSSAGVCLAGIYYGELGNVEYAYIAAPGAIMVLDGTNEGGGQYSWVLSVTGFGSLGGSYETWTNLPAGTIPTGSELYNTITTGTFSGSFSPNSSDCP